MARKDLLSRLADAGEEAIAKLADTPGGDRLMGTMNSFRDRIDELQRRVRGIDALERRVSELERRLGVEPASETTEPEPASPVAAAAGQPEDVVPPVSVDAGEAGGIGDVSEPASTSPTPPATPPPPAPVEGGAAEPFGDVPQLPDDRPFPPAETTGPEAPDDRPFPPSETTEPEPPSSPWRPTGGGSPG